MSGYLSTLLQRAYRPVKRMDTDVDESLDAAAFELRQAVREHVDAGAADAESHGTRIRSTIDDLFQKMAKDNGGHG